VSYLEVEEQGELTLSYDNFRVSNGIINPKDIMEKPAMHECTLQSASSPPKKGVKIILYAP
jgi:hypothetical protein